MDLLKLEIDFFSSLDWDYVTKVIIAKDMESLKLGFDKATKYARDKEDLPKLWESRKKHIEKFKLTDFMVFNGTEFE